MAKTVGFLIDAMEVILAARIRCRTVPQSKRGFLPSGTLDSMENSTQPLILSDAVAGCTSF
jgi:hypothetical protein